jgi:hypothetical protein
MATSLHVSYSEAINGSETVNYESPAPTDRLLTHGLYKASGALATLGGVAIMRMAEFDPGFNVVGQHIGLTEVLSAIGGSGVACGMGKVWDSIKDIQQQVQNGRIDSAPEPSQARSISKSLVIELNH